MSIWKELARCARVELDRVVLRPVRFEDAPAFYEILSNPDNLSFIFPVQTSEEQAQELMVSLFMKKPLGSWAIADKATDKLVGILHFEKVDELARRAEIGYFLHENLWNQGIMTEVVRSLAFLAFHEMGLNELVIVTHLENLASQKVATKSGFRQIRQYRGSDRYTRRMRDYLQFALNRADYLAQEMENKKK